MTMNDRKQISRTEYLIVLLALADVLLCFATLATRNAYVSALFAALVFVSGVWMLLGTARSSWRSLQVKHWPTAAYEVIEANHTWRMPSSGRNSKVVPRFTISYEFSGNRYTRSSDDGFNLPLNPVFATMQAADAYLDAVRNGKYGASVFVNPDAPTVAYLHTGIGRDRIGMLLFAVVLIVLPVLTYTGVIHWR